MTYNTKNLIVSFKNQHLNLDQIQAIKTDLTEAVTLIHGPPGNGKSTTIFLILNIIKQHPDIKILICSPSNCTVDLLTEALDEKCVDVLRLFFRKYDYVDVSTKRFSLVNKAYEKDLFLKNNFDNYIKNKLNEETKFFQ